MSEAKGLPVQGYKPTQPDWAVALVNENKVLEERILRQIDAHKARNDLDQRHVAIARTEIESAFMHLNRAVFQPQRITLPEDTGTDDGADPRDPNVRAAV
jgi:hypothetical protein